MLEVNEMKVLELRKNSSKNKKKIYIYMIINNNNNNDNDKPTNHRIPLYPTN